MTGRATIDREQVREILVRGPNWVGDLVMSTPGLRALRAGFPDARITLQVRSGHEPLLEGAPWLDRVIAVRSYHAGARSLLQEARALRRDHRFDLGLCIPDSFSSALLMRLGGVRRVVGYRRAGRDVLLHRPVTPPREWGRRRMVARERFVLELTNALGCPALDSRLELHTSERQEDAVRALLARRAIEPAGRPLVGLAPGASYGPSKLWPAEYFAELGDALVQRGAGVLLIGSPAEARLTAAVRSAMREPASDLAGELDLGAVKALVRRLSLLLCNDAGARHIAVAFGVPCLVFIGPTSLAKTDQNLQLVHVLESDVDCRPCYLRDCPTDHRCMRRIEPQTAIEMALQLLPSPAPSSRMASVMEGRT